MGAARRVARTVGCPHRGTVSTALCQVPQRDPRTAVIYHLRRRVTFSGNDTGETIDALARVSHIHLFGIAFIFFFVGYIFRHAVGFPPLLQIALIFTPFAFLLIDVLSWWLTKWRPNFAVFEIIAGIGYSIASAIMLITSLYQMWVMPLISKRPV